MKRFLAASAALLLFQSPIFAENGDSSDPLDTILATVPTELGKTAEGKDLSWAIDRLEDASRNLVSEPRTAIDALLRFVSAWPGLESRVQSTNPAAYDEVENYVPSLISSLRNGINPEGSASRIDALRSELMAVNSRQSYSAFDAASILFREGIEAMLVIAALLAVLKKAKAMPVRRWVWIGAGSGLLVSIAMGAVIVLLFARIEGSQQETFEGIVGLVCVALLLSVGAWLHGKSSIRAWNSRLKDGVSRAIGSGRSGILALIAGVAVVREGLETSVLLLGIAGHMSIADLVLGFAVASIVLVVFGYLIIRLSTVLPLRGLFLVATILIYYLALKITGDSVHSLQVATMLPIHPIAGAGSATFVAFYPTWETVVSQIVVLLFVVSEGAITEIRMKKATPARESKQQA